jgi:hypothetical protein
LPCPGKHQSRIARKWQEGQRRQNLCEMVTSFWWKYIMKGATAQLNVESKMQNPFTDQLLRGWKRKYTTVNRSPPFFEMETYRIAFVEPFRTLFRICGVAIIQQRRWSAWSWNRFHIGQEHRMFDFVMRYIFCSI